jgi:hypothetical protein
MPILFVPPSCPGSQDHIRLLYRALTSVPWVDLTAPSRSDRPLRCLATKNPTVYGDRMLPTAGSRDRQEGEDVDDGGENFNRASSLPTHALVEGEFADLALGAAGPELVFLHDPSALSHICEALF